MPNPTQMLFGGNATAIVFMAGFLVYVIALSINGYCQAETKEERKTSIAFLLVAGSLTAVSLMLSVLSAIGVIPTILQ